MDFEYTRAYDFPQHQKRERIVPWIRFGIFKPKNFKTILYPVGLIDSGSDVTIIQREFGEQLGIEIEKGDKVKIFGVGGGYIDGYLHKVGLYIHNGGEERPIIYEDIVVFSRKNFPISMPQQTALLGTYGFFNHVDVTFRFPKKIIIERKK